MAFIQKESKISFSEIVLRRLYKRGINNSVNLTAIVKKELKDQSRFDVAWSDVAQEIDKLFRPLINDELIRNYVNKTSSGLVFSSSLKYLKQIEVWATITPKGLEFYKKTKTSVDWVLIWTIIGVVVAAAIGVLSFFKIDKDMLKQKHELLKREQPKAPQLQKATDTTPKTLPSDSSHK